MKTRKLRIEINVDLNIPAWFHPFMILLIAVAIAAILFVNTKLVVGLASVLLVISIMVDVAILTGSDDDHT